MINKSQIIEFTYFYFFFQAEDGIRDGHVTGVQTCALPILEVFSRIITYISQPLDNYIFSCNTRFQSNFFHSFFVVTDFLQPIERSEERRVGKECKYKWWPEH